MTHAPAVLVSEVISALSCALDLTEGQPEGHSVRTCLIGMRIADELALGAGERSALFYALLLKDAGCSANSAATCAVFAADDREVKRSWKTVDWAGRLPSLLHVVRNARPDGTAAERIRQIAGFASAGAVGTELVRARCERGAEIAAMLEMPPETCEAVRALDEHWDGRGIPTGARGSEIPLLARIACLAQTAEIFHARGDLAAALAVARGRSGRWFDPELVRALEATGSDAGFWAGLRAGDSRARLAAVEPDDRVLTANPARLDRIASAFARVIDAKSPYTYRHSEGVAAAAVAAGAEMGMAAGELGELRRAALLHDVGKLGVSNLILDKPGKLTSEEMAAVRLHPGYTHRILSRVASMRELAEIAASHHERMDGRGYHRGVAAGSLPLSARLLCVADVYDALSADRPYRTAMPPERVRSVMAAEAGTGLCPESLAALERAVDSGALLNPAA